LDVEEPLEPQHNEQGLEGCLRTSALERTSFASPFPRRLALTETPQAVDLRCSVDEIRFFANEILPFQASNVKRLVLVPLPDYPSGNLPVSIVEEWTSSLLQADKLTSLERVDLKIKTASFGHLALAKQIADVAPQLRHLAIHFDGRAFPPSPALRRLGSGISHFKQLRSLSLHSVKSMVLLRITLGSPITHLFINLIDGPCDIYEFSAFLHPVKDTLSHLRVELRSDVGWPRGKEISTPTSLSLLEHLTVPSPSSPLLNTSYFSLPAIRHLTLSDRLTSLPLQLLDLARVTTTLRRIEGPHGVLWER
jgi:hypothetical protein